MGCTVSKSTQVVTETGKDPLARTNRERSTHEHQEKSRKMAIIQPQMQTPQPPVTEANDLKKQQDDDLPDLDDPDMEVAAIKIQSVFRGHNARKNVQKAQSVEKCPTPVEAEEEMPDLDDPELAVAATKIQSTFRGHKARKQINKQPVEKSTSVEKSPVEKSPSVEAEEEMPDLNDPELAVAATKIQSTFRGHKARKQITEKQIKPQHSTKEFDEEDTILNTDILS